MGAVLIRESDPHGALFHLRKAADANSSFALARVLEGQALILCGKFDAGFSAIEEGKRLSPRDPFLEHDLPRVLITGLFVAQRYEDMIAEADRLLKQRPDYAGPRRFRCAGLALLDHLEDAKADMAYLLETDASFSARRVLAENFLPLPHRERFVKALQLTGLPE